MCWLNVILIRVDPNITFPKKKNKEIAGQCIVQKTQNSLFYNTFTGILKMLWNTKNNDCEVWYLYC